MKTIEIPTRSLENHAEARQEPSQQLKETLGETIPLVCNSPKKCCGRTDPKKITDSNYRKWFDIDSDWRLIALSTSMPTLPWPLFNISHWPSVQTGQRGNGSLGVCRLPLLGAEEAPQEHAPRFDPTWLRKCAFYWRFNSGFVHFWNISGTCRQNFCHAFSTWQVEKNWWNVPLLGFPDSSPCSLCDLALLIWEKTGSTFSSSFYVWCWSLDVLVLSGKKWKKKTHKKNKRNIKEFCCKCAK